MRWFVLFLCLATNSYAEVEPVLIRTLTTVTGGGLSVTGSTVNAIGIYEVFTTSVNVSGGTGFVVVTTTGTLLHCAINPVVSTATYNFNISTNDSDQFNLFGKCNLTGKTTLIGKRFLMGSYKAQINQTTSNGDYRLQCVIQR